MEARNTVIATAGAIITVQVGLFAWLKSDVADLAMRVDRVEREVAFIRGQLSLALPAPAAQTAADPESEP